MPKYGRRRFGPRRSVRSTFGQRGWRGVSGKYSRESMVAAARGLNAATRGMQLAQGEFKAIDTTTNGDLNTTGTIALVNGCARGDDINARIGREIVMRSVQIEIDAQSTDTTGIAQEGRILLVYDRQANGAAPTFANVLAATGASLPISPRNLENRRRFKILMDKKFVLGPQGATTTALGGQSVKHFKFYRRLRHPVTFNSGNAGTIADITSGSLYLMGCNGIAPGATDGFWSAYTRVRYEDK